MIECAVALALWWSAVGPNDFLLTAAVARTDPLERRLVPLERMIDRPALWLVEHARADWPQAFFVAEGEAGGRLPALSLGTRRLLPAVRGPRLFVHRSLFAEGGLEAGFRPLESLAVDEAEKLFRALFEAFFFHHLEASPGAAATLSKRAQELMAEAPEGHRREAYVGAAEDFVAHLLSISHELGRHRRRKSADQLCALLRHPATLFGFWRRTLATGSFHGLYPRLDAGVDTPARSPLGGRRQWVRTSAVLEPEDKAWLLADVLAMPASGEPEQDFAFMCR